MGDAKRVKLDQGTADFVARYTQLANDIYEDLKTYGKGKTVQIGFDKRMKEEKKRSNHFLFLSFPFLSSSSSSSSSSPPPLQPQTSLLSLVNGFSVCLTTVFQGAR